MGGITVAYRRLVTILSYVFVPACHLRVSGEPCDHRTRFAVKNCLRGGFPAGAETVRPCNSRISDQPPRRARMFSTTRWGATDPIGLRQCRNHNV